MAGGYNENIRYAIKAIAESNSTNGVFLARVTAVYTDARTCDVTTFDRGNNAKIGGVKLSTEPNDGHIKVPGIDSTVLVLHTVNDDNYYVIMTEDLQEIIVSVDGDTTTQANNISAYASAKLAFSAATMAVSAVTTFNEGNYGGMVKVNDLVTQLNRLEDAVQRMFNALLTWTPTTPTPTLGDIATLKAAIVASGVLVNSMTPVTSASDLSNDDVKH